MGAESTSTRSSRPESYRDLADSTESTPNQLRVSLKWGKCRIGFRTRLAPRRVRYDSAESYPTQPILRTLLWVDFLLKPGLFPLAFHLLHVAPSLYFLPFMFILVGPQASTNQLFKAGYTYYIRPSSFHLHFVFFSIFACWVKHQYPFWLDVFLVCFKEM